MRRAPVVPSRGRLRPLGVDEVTITGGFWGSRQQANGANTLAHCHGWMERLGWIGNFERAADGTAAGKHQGMMFADSESYKLLEGLSWEVGRSGASAAASTDLEERLRTLTATIAAAQESDGYLDTYFGRAGSGRAGSGRASQPPRYSDLEWGHELYNFGHLIQAGVARGRTAGSDQLVDVAVGVADHICATFGPGGIERVGGHPEVEMALAELARLTGEQRYLDQAALFIERRGRQTLADISLGRAYFQDDVPIRQATVFRGHAVRALYLASGAVDVAVETGDDDLLAAIVQQWERTIARRTYLTGGMGSHHTGESFGEDFVLPPDRAYSETCAGIASVMLAWRLLLATGEPRFADVIERTLYNVVATSPAPDGRAFFYANPLHQRVPGAVPDPDVESRRASSSLREPWFHVACCPTNISRTYASLGAYIATADDATAEKGGIQLHQYVPSRIATTLGSTADAADRRVVLEVATDYPREGAVTVRVAESDGRPWTLTLRVPPWAEGAELAGPAGRRPVSAGTVDLEWPFSAGDEVTLTLPLEPRWTYPDPRIDAVRGCVAVERGPVVMCAESVDLPGGGDPDGVNGLAVDPAVQPRDLFDGEAGDAVVVAARLLEPDDPGWPYGEPGADHADEPPGGGTLDVPLHPYHDWGNRGPATMRVWIPCLHGEAQRGIIHE